MKIEKNGEKIKPNVHCIMILRKAVGRTISEKKGVRFAQTVIACDDFRIPNDRKRCSQLQKKMRSRWIVPKWFVNTTLYLWH